MKSINLSDLNVIDDNYEPKLYFEIKWVLDTG